jgi:hypothetical protein
MPNLLLDGGCCPADRGGCCAVDGVIGGDDEWVSWNLGGVTSVIKGSISSVGDLLTALGVVSALST